MSLRDEALVDYLDDWDNRRAISRRSELPDHIARLLAAYPEAHDGLVSQRWCPPDVLDLIARTNQRLCPEIVGARQAETATLVYIAGQLESRGWNMPSLADLVAKVSAHRHCTPQVISALATHVLAEVRQVAAADPRCSVTDLAALAGDSDPDVCQAALHNPSCPAHIKAIIALGSVT